MSNSRYNAWGVVNENNPAPPAYPATEPKVNEAMTLQKQIALAREWITDATHHDGCNSRRYDQDGSWPSGNPCDCGRDALLKALEVPR